MTYSLKFISMSVLWFLCNVLPTSALADSGRIKVHVSSFPSFGKDSFFYLAQERGMYDQAGIDFAFEGTFLGALSPVELGRVEIAQELCSLIIQAIEQGAPLRIIGARDAIFPVGTISLSDAHITTPAAYSGKRWATSAGANPEITVMDELGKRSGFDPKTVTLINIPFNARVAALIARQADFASAWYGSGYPEFAHALRKAGVSFDFVRWSNFGIDLYGQCFAARTAWLEEHSDVARAFLRSTIRAIREAITNPSAAVDATIKLNANAGLQRDVVLEQWREAQELLFDQYAREHGVLSLDPAKIEKIREIVSPGGNVTAEQLYTNEYLPTN